MQSEYEPRDATATRPLVIAIVVGFIVEAIVATFFAGGREFLLKNAFLTLENLRGLRIWTLATYPLVEPGVRFWSVVAVVFNAIMVHLLGRTVVSLIGTRGFWKVCAAAVLTGGLFTIGVAALRGGSLPGLAAGASVIVLALLTIFACFHPDRPISFLLAFVIPVTIKPKYLVWFIAGLAGFAFIFFELQGEIFATPPSNLLGGMLAAWLYHRFVHQQGAVFQSSGPAIEMPAWMKRKKKKVTVAAASTNYKVNISSPQSASDIRAEVDRILDKINSKGFGALTTDERRILDEARDTLNKR